MTIDEAIKHCEEVAEENQAIVDSCDYYGKNMAKCEECAKEHRQLATWLRELKAYRNKSQERDNESCDEIWEKAYKEREGKKMNDSFELTLNNPLTKEDWDKITDVELENTPSITFKTPKGKQVKYIKSDILGKIRKEIEEKEIILNCTEVSDVASKTAYIEALKIIDKYRAESEE